MVFVTVNSTYKLGLYPHFDDYSIVIVWYLNHLLIDFIIILVFFGYFGHIYIYGFNSFVVPLLQRGAF